MSRGDKRERDRAKNQAKLAARQKSQSAGGDVQKRNEGDKAALEKKIAMKKAAQEAALKDAATATKGPVPRKKKPTKDVGLDDLLSSGLSGNKKKGKK
mmetsp:Transcript_22773/g.27432  ORF Transcript_22773/g.27432 Transcript_22773/m.27432 type:complete len:98 (+) Transcript_22773:137-430(+)